MWFKELIACLGLCAGFKGTSIAPTLTHAYTICPTIRRELHGRLWVLWTYHCVFDTVTQTNSNAIGLVDAQVDESCRQSVAQLIKLLVRHFLGCGLNGSSIRTASHCFFETITNRSSDKWDLSMFLVSTRYLFQFTMSMDICAYRGWTIQPSHSCRLM